jgi:hypothetical protein
LPCSRPPPGRPSPPAAPHREQHPPRARRQRPGTARRQRQHARKPPRYASSNRADTKHTRQRPPHDARRNVRPKREHRPQRNVKTSMVVRGRVELPTFRFSEGLSPFCPPSQKRIISPADLRFRWQECQVLRHGHGTTSAAVCRGMPFCPCYFRVDLRLGPGLVLLLCWRESPDSQGYLPAADSCQRPPQGARRTAGTWPAARDAPVPAGWRFPAATRHTGGPSAPDCRGRFRSTTVRTRRSPPSPHRPGAGRITHSNEKRLLSTSKSRRTMLLWAVKRLDDIS